MRVHYPAKEDRLIASNKQGKRVKHRTTYHKHIPGDDQKPQTDNQRVGREERDHTHVDERQATASERANLSSRTWFSVAK